MPTQVLVVLLFGYTQLLLQNLSIKKVTLSKASTSHHLKLVLLTNTNLSCSGYPKPRSHSVLIDFPGLSSELASFKCRSALHLVGIPTRKRGKYRNLFRGRSRISRRGGVDPFWETWTSDDGENVCENERIGSRKGCAPENLVCRSADAITIFREYCFTDILINSFKWKDS